MPHVSPLPGNLTFASIFPNRRERRGAGAEGGGEPGADGLHYRGEMISQPSCKESGPCFLSHWGLLLLFSFSFLVLLFLEGGRWAGGRSRALEVAAAAKPNAHAQDEEEMRGLGVLGSMLEREGARELLRDGGGQAALQTGCFCRQSTAGVLLCLLRSCSPGGPDPGQPSAAQRGWTTRWGPGASPDGSASSPGPGPELSPNSSCSFCRVPRGPGHQNSPRLGWAGLRGSWHWFGRRLLDFISFY